MFVHDKRAKNNASFIQNEANELLKLIDFHGLYRKGLYLYDVEKYRPVYSIVEYVWAFSPHPSFAYQLSEYLEKVLQDMENPNDMTKCDIDEWVRKFYPMVEEELLKKRGKHLCRFMHFFCTKKVVNCIHSNDFFAVIDKLNSLKKNGWEPAQHFLHKILKYSNLKQSFKTPLFISNDMCDFFGVPHNTQLSIVMVIKKMAEYIKNNNLQNPNNENEIIPDKKLISLLQGYWPDADQSLKYSTLQKYIKCHMDHL